MQVGRYAKTIVAVVIGAAVAAQAAITDGTITNAEWVTIGLAALTAAGVYVFPNKDPNA